jgi:hypothetical protein
VNRAVLLAKVRFHANAYGLGVVKIEHAEFMKKQKKKRSSTLPASFDSDLHVWGRPFFITDDHPEEVSCSIDRYLAASSSAEVKKIVDDMLDRLDPQLVGKIEPAPEGHLPDDADLANGLRWKLDTLRAALRAFKAGEKKFQGQDGESHDPKQLLQTALPHALLEFAAIFQPGWMGRGYVWPTHLIDEAELDPEGLFESARFWIEPLLPVLKGIKIQPEATIAGNFTVGGCVRPDRVPALRQWLEANASVILKKCKDCEVDWRKLMEAVLDAERRNLGFAEATEIYSGPMGIMN